MSERLLIVGASARAAAFSARRAGIKPLAADLFGDVDLQCCCPTLRVECYPLGLIDALRKIDHSWQLGRTPWMITGALENQPDLVEQMAAEWPLYGNRAEVLRSIRDPAMLADALSAGGFLYPQTVLSVDRWEIGRAHV